MLQEFHWAQSHFAGGRPVKGLAGSRPEHRNERAEMTLYQGAEIMQGPMVGSLFGHALPHPSSGVSLKS